MAKLLKEIWGRIPHKLKRGHVIDWIRTANVWDLFELLEEVGKPVSERTQAIVMMSESLREWFNEEVVENITFNFEDIWTQDQTRIAEEVADRLRRAHQQNKNSTDL